MKIRYWILGLVVCAAVGVGCSDTAEQVLADQEAASADEESSSGESTSMPADGVEGGDDSVTYFNDEGEEQEVFTLNKDSDKQDDPEPPPPTAPPTTLSEEDWMWIEYKFDLRAGTTISPATLDLMTDDGMEDVTVDVAISLCEMLDDRKWDSDQVKDAFLATMSEEMAAGMYDVGVWMTAEQAIEWMAVMGINWCPATLDAFLAGYST